MDYQRLNNERITSTKIAPYDMITTVSQRAINKQLENMHKVNESLQTMKLLSADPEDEYSCLEADLDAPTIELLLETENRTVIFCVNISRATLKYQRIKSGKVQQESLELPACTLALSVNLAFETAVLSSLPQKVQDRLKALNNYSTKQLLVDFTNASLARLYKKKTTVYKHIEDVIAIANFNIFIETYFAVLEKNNAFIIHYIPFASDEARKEYKMPTVPPTDLTFQNLPFVQNDRDRGHSSDDNMLVYLQMCRGNPLPRQLLDVSANWIVPTPTNDGRYDGTVALSADTFLNGWLLKKLADFNRRSTWIVTDAWWKQNGLFGTRFNLSGKLGRDGPEADVAWTAVGPTFVDSKIREKVNGQPGQWYMYYYNNKKDDNDHILFRVWMQGTTSNWLFIPEGYNRNGKCEIHLYGNTLIEFYVHLDIPSSNGSVNAEWSTKIVLDGVNDGELIINADNINPNITRTIDEAWLHKGVITSVTTPAEEGLKSLSMTDILHDMRSVFKDGWAFILPGAAEFYISRAVFNREKDLLCELKYKFQA